MRGIPLYALEIVFGVLQKTLDITTPRVYTNYVNQSTTYTEGSHQMDEQCRCDGSQMNGSDHCQRCFCEQFEERCDWEENKQWSERSEGAKFSQAMRRGKKRREF